ncbi:MAG: hypothetical protein ACRD44_18120, partial [Bryobacteraceae bacterium]
AQGSGERRDCRDKAGASSMKHEDKTRSPVLGLDVGTSRIVVARRATEGYQYESQLNAFVSVPFSKMTSTALEREQVPFVTRGGEIIVHGNESQRFADLLSVETRRPMTEGVLNPGENDGMVVIRSILESLAGASRQGADRICFSVPAPPLGAEENLTYHEASLSQMLTEMGFQARSINEGLAVIFSELEDTNFTGIGVSCGGGLCNVSMAYLSMPVLSFSVAKAGDFIDSSAAAVVGELANRIRITKETSFHLNGFVSDKMHKALTVYYDDVIQTLVTALRDALNASRRPKFARPVPVAVSGGTAAPAGFRERFEKALQESELPVEISEVRMASDPLHATARGALIAGMAEM